MSRPWGVWSNAAQGHALSTAPSVSASRVLTATSKTSNSSSFMYGNADCGQIKAKFQDFNFNNIAGSGRGGTDQTGDSSNEVPMCIQVDTPTTSGNTQAEFDEAFETISADTHDLSIATHVLEEQEQCLRYEYL